MKIYNIFRMSKQIYFDAYWDMLFLSFNLWYERADSIYCTSLAITKIRFHCCFFWLQYSWKLIDSPSNGAILLSWWTGLPLKLPELLNDLEFFFSIRTDRYIQFNSIVYLICNPQNITGIPMSLITEPIYVKTKKAPSFAKISNYFFLIQYYPLYLAVYSGQISVHFNQWLIFYIF